MSRSVSKSVRRPVAGVRGLPALLTRIREVIRSARSVASSAVNSLQVRSNFEIGRMIVEHEQHGAARAGYGETLLQGLSARLAQEFGRGYSRANLEYMRRFYLEWKNRPLAQGWHPRLPQTMSGTVAAKGGNIPQTVSGKSAAARRTIPQTVSGESAVPVLSWSHYILLLTIRDPAERSFYEIEAGRAGWSLAELRRQVTACLYERLALSRDRAGIARLAREGQVIAQPADLFKEPLVLEFLGLEERPAYSESDLESAIIGQLERFLLEIGKGFLFEARQKRFTFDGDHYFVDLVFYNRLLRCYVLIDLKLGQVSHQDLGQMQMYVNHFDRTMKLPAENSTVGIVLCKRKKQAMVELTLPKDANIHAKEYQLYLPSKKLLQSKLLEWTLASEGKA